MSKVRRWIADLLMTVSTVVLPPAKGEWLQAMKSEMAHISNRNVLGFAAGCLFACVTERFRVMSNLPDTARHFLVAALLVIAALTMRSSARMSGTQSWNAWIFAGVASSYVLAACWSMLAGGAGLVQAGLMLLILNLGAAIWLFWGSAVMVRGFDASLISAVAFEGAVIWLFVLILCLVCTRQAAHHS